MPHLPVIAAGSLLDLTLADHAFSMPVGRVSFYHVEPMGFDEYLRAHGQARPTDFHWVAKSRTRFARRHARARELVGERSGRPSTA